jgi:hypothetical protein
MTGEGDHLVANPESEDRRILRRRGNEPPSRVGGEMLRAAAASAGAALKVAAAGQLRIGCAVAVEDRPAPEPAELRAAKLGLLQLNENAT